MLITMKLDCFFFLSSIYCNDNNIFNNNIFKHILYNYCDIRYVVLSCGEIKTLIIYYYYYYYFTESYIPTSAGLIP